MSERIEERFLPPHEPRVPHQGAREETPSARFRRNDSRWAGLGGERVGTVCDAVRTKRTWRLELTRPAFCFDEFRTGRMELDAGYAVVDGRDE